MSQRIEESLGPPNVECPECLGGGWSCEIHVGRPWAGWIGDEGGCAPGCAGPGVPCRCRPGARRHRPFADIRGSVWGDEGDDVHLEDLTGALLCRATRLDVLGPTEYRSHERWLATCRGCLDELERLQAAETIRGR